MNQPLAKTMAATNTTDPEATTTAIVTIRVPCGANADLVTDAEKRLSRAEDIEDVTIDELRSIDPKLSATVITVDVTLRQHATVPSAVVRKRLTGVPGLVSHEIE
jgi:hypothetical protein